MLAPWGGRSGPSSPGWLTPSAAARAGHPGSPAARPGSVLGRTAQRFVCALTALLVEPLLARAAGSASSPGAAAAAFVASRSCSTIRSVASSRFRSCERSSWAIARTTGPSLSSTRARSASVSAAEPSTSNSASTRVELFCACWPPGPLDRLKRNATSERIDSTSMAAILLDVDGVLHVSGEPIPGAVDAVRRLRAAGHRIRFVTNSTTMSRAQLGEHLRALGFAIEDDELQTTGSVAARVLKGKRVLAMTMPGILDDLDGLELIGMNADAVLIGGADETEEPGPDLLVPEPEPRVPRAAGRRRLLLPAPQPLVADGRRPAARLGRVRRRARVRVRDRGDGARQAEPGVLRRGARGDRRRRRSSTWMVGDDIEGDVVGAQRHGMRTVLVRTGKFRPDDLEETGVMPDGIVSSIAQLPDWLELNL